MENEELINGLKEIATGLHNQTFNRQIQIEILKAKGFLKLAEKNSSHLKEESEYLQETIKHIINLDGDCNFNGEVKIKVFENPIDLLKNEYEISKNGLILLKEIINKAKEEFMVYDFLVEYYKDEQEDMNWTKTQLELIKTIGEENFLINQI